MSFTSSIMIPKLFLLCLQLVASTGGASEPSEEENVQSLKKKSANNDNNNLPIIYYLLIKLNIKTLKYVCNEAEVQYVYFNKRFLGSDRYKLVSFASVHLYFL